MSVVALVGGQWGDEGKGKIVDGLAEKANVVIRFSGGDNAGHTTVNPYGEFKLHLVPSGIFHPHVTCIIGNGVVVNPAVLLKEITELNERGVDTSRLLISDRAHLIMPYHTLLDDLEEERRGKGALGTTKRGIGPAFSDKVARMGIKVGDLLNEETFSTKLSSVLELKNALLTKLYNREALSHQEILEQYLGYREQLAPYIRETDSFIHDAVARRELVLLEGAQGTLLDPDFGTYPFVTSSSPLAGAASLGSGIGPTKIDRSVGVFKAYITRVGSGPMPTELSDETGELIREQAQEYGATTGRPRRCGWFDAVAGRLSVRVNGLTDMVLTHLDIFDGFESVKICTAYRCGSEVLEQFPSRGYLLEKCTPVYEELPGWSQAITDSTRFKDLPREAQGYVRRLEELLDCPMSLIAVGPKRDQVIQIRPVEG
ncbi:MAG: adenylosuccinate synthase [Chloroflexota bacterium]